MLRIWSEKSPQAGKVCEHCYHLMISSPQPDQRHEKKSLPRTVQVDLRKRGSAVPLDDELAAVESDIRPACTRDDEDER